MSTQRLLCAHRGSINDEKLYWCIFDGTSWSGDLEFNNGAKSTSAPALAVYNGTLYCVHRGQTGNNNLWWCTFDETQHTWSTDLPLEGDNRSSDTPALAVNPATNQLFMVHKGGDDDWMWWSYFDPITQKWAPDLPFKNDNQANAGPALHYFNNMFYCVHRGSGNEALWWCTFQDGEWTEDERFCFDNVSMRNPALFEKDGSMYCVHRGGSANTDEGQQLWWCKVDGANWTADTKFKQGNLSADGPAVAVFNEEVYCVHRGVTQFMEVGSDDSLYYTKRLENGDWGEDIKFRGGNRSADGPALAVVNY